MNIWAPQPQTWALSISGHHNPKRGLNHRACEQSSDTSDCLGLGDPCPLKGPIRSFSYAVVRAIPPPQKVVSQVLEPRVQGSRLFSTGLGIYKIRGLSLRNLNYLNTYWQMDYCNPGGKACLREDFWGIYIGLILPLLWKWTFYFQDTRLCQRGPRCWVAG